MKESIERFPKSSKLFLINGFMQFEQMENRYLAFFELSKAVMARPDIYDSFTIYMYNYVFEDKIIEIDAIPTEGRKNIDVGKVIAFQDGLVDFIKLVDACVQLHVEFWNELSEKAPDITKLQSLGSFITREIEICAEKFEVLQSVNDKNIKLMRVYGYFLQIIANNIEESTQILEKLMINQQRINSNKLDLEANRFGANANTCVMALSGNYNTMGIINNINTAMVPLLGY